MQYIEFQRAFKSFTVFSLADIRQAEPGFYRRRLNEWQAKGYIRKVIKGHYVFADTELNENTLLQIANRIYAPSYVSFEFALSHYGLIPESIYGITSASTRKTMSFTTPLGEYSYQSIQPKLYFGFDYHQANERYYKIALPVKALLDYLYLHPGIKTTADFKALRLNRAKARQIIHRDEMRRYLPAYGRVTLKRQTAVFWEYLDHA